MKLNFVFLINLIFMLSSCETKNLDVTKNVNVDTLLKDGIKHISSIRNGKRYGLSIGYYLNGSIHDSSFYKDDLLDGKVVEYYPNGQLKKEAFYIRHEADGNYIKYHDNGNISERGIYFKGEASGWYYEYFKNGKIKKKGEHIKVRGKDILNQVYLYDSTGNLLTGKNLSSFIKITPKKDTISINEEYDFEIKLMASVYSDLTNQMTELYVGNFDVEFNEIGSEKIIPIASFDYTINYKVKPSKVGWNEAIGYVADDSTYIKGKPYPCIQRCIFFKKKFFVK